MTEIRLPFSGFYESSHDSEMCYALEQAFPNDSDQEAYDAAVDRVNWRVLREAYAAGYAKILSDKCSLPGLTFNRLYSPREYNFETDQIICDLPADTLADIYERADKTALAALVAERLKQCPGFIPFYSDVLIDWGSFETWESPQVDLLIESWCNEHEDSTWRDYDAMEGYRCNAMRFLNA